MIKFTDEQIKSMRDGYPPSEYDFEEAVISLSYEVSELRECLKVAEDALDKVYKCIDNRYGVDESLLAKNIIADALAAIREEGGMK